MHNLNNERVDGLKVGFSEKDIRRRQGCSVVYLDRGGKKPVPNPYERCEHLSWPRDRETKKLMIENAARNRPRSPGGLKTLVGPEADFILLGPGFPTHRLREKPPGWKVVSMAGSDGTESEVDFFFSHSPSGGQVETPAGSPIGIFGLSSNHRDVSSYRQRKYFFSTIWTARNGSLPLIDLVDPLSSLVHLMSLWKVRSVIFMNHLPVFCEDAPGRVKWGQYFLYPQQAISLSLSSALLFWLSHSGVALYTLTGDFADKPPADLLSFFEEIDNGGQG